MKRIAAGIVGVGVAGAAVALGVAAPRHGGGDRPAAVALTAGGAWTFSPTIGLADAGLVQAPLRSQLEWVVPGTFSNSNPADDMTGELLIRPTGGSLHQPDFQFVTPGYGGTNPDVDSALYAYGPPTGSGYFYPAYYFAPNGAGDATGSAGRIDGPFGTINLSSASSWLVHPADYTKPITYSDVLGIQPDGMVDWAAAKVPFNNVLALGPGGPGDWTLNPGGMTTVMYQDTPIWHLGDATYTAGSTTLDGTVYLNSAAGALGLYNEKFVTTDGALYYYSQGILGFDNMYYAPGAGGAVVDILKTPLGDMNLSALSWLFTPPDYSGADPADAIAVLSGMLTDPALSKTIDFGQSVADVEPAAADAAYAAT